MISTIEQANTLVISAEKDPAALAEIKSSAENGEVFGEFALAEVITKTNYRMINYAEAAFWYKKAATQGMAEAQFILGRFYETGYGAPGLANAILEDKVESVYWYRQAANQGHFNAQYNLGEMHYFGKGCLKSNIAAYALTKFAVGKLGIAEDACEEVAQKMSAKELKTANQLFEDMSKKGEFLMALDQHLANT
jgi:TPR repeat protein